MTPETSWIGRSMALTYDSVSEHLLAINLDETFVFEADLDGRLIRTYGREGEGPGELKNPLDIVATPRGIFVVDLGNMKLARFPRAGGKPLETRLGSYYYDIVGGAGDLLYAVPGWDGEAVAVFDLTGDRVGGFGARDVLPGSCTDCMVSPLGSTAVLVVEPDTPELIIIENDGTLRRRLPLNGVAVLRRWQEEEAAIFDRRPDLRGGKLWISDVEVVDETIVLLAMTPPRPFERGRELWKVDLSQDLITRYKYDQPEAGAVIAVRWPSVFTILVRDGAIREYRVPEE